MRAQRGIALVVVLWGVLLLALLSGAIAGLARTEARLAEAHLARARHAAALESAIAWSTQRLLDGRPGRRLPVDGSPTTFEFEGRKLEVRATLEAGRIDLNAADDALLEALFRAQGLPQSEAAAWVAKLRDWQDADDERRLGGAESADYRAAGLNYGPRNGPLKSVEELQLLLGMPRQLALCVSEAATVYTNAPTPDIHHLRPAARAVLAWADQQSGSQRWLPATVSPSQQPPSVVGQVIRLELRSTDDSKQPGPLNEVIGRLSGGAGHGWVTIAIRAIEDGNIGNCELL